MKLTKTNIFQNSRVLKPRLRKVITPEQMDSELVAPRQAEVSAAKNVKPSQLVYRNYWWVLVDGPGIVYEEHDFDDGSGPDPEFDFLTVSLMGWNAVFADGSGRPSPFPQAVSFVNCGEFPMSRRYWLQMGFVDPFLDHESYTVQLLPWTGAIQIGLLGWKQT